MDHLSKQRGFCVLGLSTRVGFVVCSVLLHTFHSGYTLCALGIPHAEPVESFSLPMLSGDVLDAQCTLDLLRAELLEEPPRRVLLSSVRVVLVTARGAETSSLLLPVGVWECLVSIVSPLLDNMVAEGIVVCTSVVCVCGLSVVAQYAQIDRRQPHLL